MTNKNSFAGICLGVLILLAACQQDKFIKTIPLDETGKPDFAYQQIQQYIQEIEIDTLQSGYDSLQIRIWCLPGLLSIKELLVIKQTGTTWSAQDYSLENNQDTPGNYRLSKKAIKNVSPKSGWNNFIQQLQALNISTLPDMNAIPGLTDNWADGISYSVEVSTKRYYRFYSYHMPHKFEKQFPQAKQMSDILRLIQNELDFDGFINAF